MCEEENLGSNTMLGICNLYSQADIDYRSTCVLQYAEAPFIIGKIQRVHNYNILL